MIGLTWQKVKNGRRILDWTDLQSHQTRNDHAQCSSKSQRLVFTLRLPVQVRGLVTDHTARVEVSTQALPARDA
jgi:hypothetical protein